MTAAAAFFIALALSALIGFIAGMILERFASEWERGGNEHDPY